MGGGAASSLFFCLRARSFLVVGGWNPVPRGMGSLRKVPLRKISAVFFSRVALRASCTPTRTARHTADGARCRMLQGAEAIYAFRSISIMSHHRIRSHNFVMSHNIAHLSHCIWALFNSTGGVRKPPPLHCLVLLVFILY